MKTLVIQSNGEHEENRNFRECFSLKRAFEKNKIDCDIWGLGHPNYKEGAEVDFNAYDLIINLENYDATNWVPNLSNLNCIKMLWSIDAHFVGEKVFEDTFSEGEYDILLHSTKDFVKDKHHRWFPNSFDDTLIKRLDIDKEHFFGFCGNVVNRGAILKYLSSEMKLKQDIFVIGNKMVEAINSYEIHFNLNVANDINYRSFETIGCGTALCTNANLDYAELGFVNGENCIMYHDATEVPSILGYYKYNPGLLSKIKDNGYQLSKLHTYEKRIGLILDYYEEVR